jgi:hypothetical protein
MILHSSCLSTFALQDGMWERFNDTLLLVFAHLAHAIVSHSLPRLDAVPLRKAAQTR